MVVHEVDNAPDDPRCIVEAEREVAAVALMYLLLAVVEDVEAVGRAQSEVAEVDRDVGDPVVDELGQLAAQPGCRGRAQLTVELDGGVEPPAVGGEGDPGSQQV